MTNVPNDPIDPIDPYESRLARRVGSFSDQAVVPIDPVAIAASAAVGARRQTLTGRLFGSTRPAARLAAIGAGALLIVALGAVIGAGGLGPSQSPIPTQGAVGPVATATPVPGSQSADVCTHRMLSGQIVRWEGAAGHRIATITVRNDAPVPCRLPTLVQATLTDNQGQPLISGGAVSATSSISLAAAGGSATTLVDVSNYCGAAPKEPVLISFTMPDGGTFGLVSSTGAGDLGGVPPCNGPTVPGEIQMQPFKLAG
jgi:hypothetical protein